MSDIDSIFKVILYAQYIWYLEELIESNIGILDFTCGRETAWPLSQRYVAASRSNSKTFKN
jgi:hypothetical protein